MAEKYLIKLTPHDLFFFGGEKTFGDKVNYLVRSNDFPQQTALLGLLRYQLLRESDCFDKDDNRILKKKKHEVPALIGPSSFDINEPFNFGKIISISPVFIARQKESEVHYFFRANNEYQVDEKTDETQFLQLRKFEKPKDSEESKESEKEYFYQLGGYEPKYGLQPFYQAVDEEEFLKPDDIFTEHGQTGIRKNYQGETEDNAYYIQFFRRFKNTAKCQYAFAFIAELDKSVNPDQLNQNKVVLGAEQCTFKMECLPFDQTFEALIPDFQSSENSKKIVLVSDAYVGNKNPLASSNFAITDTVDFRFLQTTVAGTENYADLDRSGDKKSPKVTKSSKFNLYKKGSVFYAEDTADLENLFKHNDFKNFRQLGYNQIKIIEKA